MADIARPYDVLVKLLLVGDDGKLTAHYLP